MSSVSRHFNPSNFLDFAEQILNDRDYDERSKIRTAIGRAYYASFLMVKKKLEETGRSFLDVDRIHRQVIEEAVNWNSQIANKLETLRSHRVDADYEMNANIAIDIARKCTRISRSILNSLPAL